VYSIKTISTFIVLIIMYSEKEKQDMLKLAREAIETAYKGENPKLPDGLNEKRGVFVTLKKNNELRGCIGFPDAVYPLKEAIVKAARAAAFNDPRFPPLREEELKDIEIEISVLTPKEEIAPDPQNITIGKHGLIVEYGLLSGLLLPQVAVEQGWDAEEFLNQVCIKAGMPPFVWKRMPIKLYRFEAEVFSETQP